MADDDGDKFVKLRDLATSPNDSNRSMGMMTPAERNRLRLGLAPRHPEIERALRESKPVRDEYTCVQEYDPSADEPSDDGLD